MFTATLFTIAKRQKQPTCPLMDECKQNMVYTYNGILFNLKRKEISTHATTQINLEKLCYNEIRQL